MFNVQWLILPLSIEHCALSIDFFDIYFEH
jgi:hypothetical protein